MFDKRYKYLIRAITAIISGVIWIESPIFVSGFIGIVIGLLLATKGVIDFLTYLASRNEIIGSKIILIESLLAFAFGLFSMIVPHFIASVLSILIALYFIIDGIVKHSSALLWREKSFIWWAGEFINIVEMILGVLMLIDPFGSSLAIIFIGGLGLILNGIHNLLKFVFNERVNRTY